MLTRAAAAYDRIQTYQAHFTQTIDNPMFAGEDVTTGRLYLAKPDRFAMRFDDPEGDRIVVDGEWFWVFTPSSTPGQVIRTAIPEAGPATPNLFAQFVDRPKERYDVTWLGTGTRGGAVTDKLLLSPKPTAGLPFKEAVIYVGRSDGVIHGLELVEETGQRRVLVFNAIRLNQAVPDGELSFRAPRGVRVVVP